MERQRNITQMKEQTRNTEAQINEKEMKEIIVKINKTKRGFFEKIKLTDLQPDSLRKKMNKQTNKNNTNLTLYEAYTNHWTSFRRAETKRKKVYSLEAWEKETTSTISLKEIMKRQRNTTHTKEQTRNTDVQINEEETGKLPENSE